MYHAFLGWGVGLLLGMWGGVCHAQEGAFVRAHGHRFELEGRAFRFVGFNLRNLVNYGKWDPAGGSSTEGHIDENLDEAQRIGAKVLRVFVALNTKSDGEHSRPTDSKAAQ